MTELSEISDRDLHREQRRRNKLRRKRSRQAKGLGQRKKGMGCRIGDRDHGAMVARAFDDPGSYIRKDGSEKLVGKDLAKRQDEIRARSGGQCEQRANFDGVILRCWHAARHFHHIVKRSVRRDDRAKNLMHICEEHHNLKHPEFKVRSGKVGA